MTSGYIIYGTGEYMKAAAAERKRGSERGKMGPKVTKTRNPFLCHTKIMGHELDYFAWRIAHHNEPDLYNVP